jgi:DNA mismatch endonuclease, patch repair protein
MADRVDKLTRGLIMAKVQSKNTSPEREVRSTLHRAGHRFTLHQRDLPGSPDIVLPRHRMVVFVHGCFWHRHGCKRARMPSTNEEYWRAKFERNTRRDRKTQRALRALGWRVFVVWTCDLDRGTRRVLAALAA